MLGNISFIGGIHGVGKSTVCTDICTQAGLKHLSASELIKWKDINSDAFNKKVQNIPGTQDRLINALTKVVQPGTHYLLDGHYCLLDNEGNITPVPVETFRAMKPIALHVITGNVSEIKQRLETRDAKTYDAELLEQMQESELSHARHLSSLLNVELCMGTQADYDKIVIAIKRAHQI